MYCPRNPLHPILTNLPYIWGKFPPSFFYYCVVKLYQNSKQRITKTFQIWLVKYCILMFYSILTSFPTIKLFASHPVRFLVFYNGDIHVRSPSGWPTVGILPTSIHYLHCRHVKIAAVTPAWEQTSIAFKIGKCNAVTMDERRFRNAYGVGYLCRAQRKDIV